MNPIPLNKYEMNLINKQMVKCVCKIYNGDIIGTGFFIKIKSQNNKIYPVLVTNNHILEEKDIEKGKSITISIDNDYKFIIIDIDDSRITFTDQLFDCTFIQIKEVDDQFLNTCDYLEIDERIYDNNGLSKNESLYILNYPKGNEIVNSQGLLVGIKGFEIMYNCKTEKGSSGSPILLLETCKVIGIHFQGGNNGNFEVNKGILINYPIIEFQNYLNDTPIENRKENIPFEISNIKGNLFSTNNIKINKINTPLETTNIKINKFNTPLETTNIKINEFNIPLETTNINKNIINTPLEKKNNSMTIKYKINKNDKQLKLFGKQFVIKNQNNCIMIIDGKEQKISEMIYLNQIRDKDILKIKLIEKKTITDMSYLFGGDYFEGCKSLIELPDIDNWDTRYVTDMSRMFKNCALLSSLPDISKWDTSKVTNMNKMFCMCKSLLYLPDISKWDTSNVTDMASMFESCSNLRNLPDINKWDISKVSNMQSMFFGCSPSLNIPNKFKNGCYIY